jgi:RNA recognition motif-containing protein
MGKKLFVGNLPWSTRATDLEDIMGQKGLAFASAEVLMDHDDPCRSRGFGFLHFDTEGDAAAARAALVDLDVGGRTIRVDDASSNRGGRSESRGRGGGRRESTIGRGRRSDDDGVW